MLLYGTGFDWMPTTQGNSFPASRNLFGQLGYYGLPGGPAPTDPQISATSFRFAGKSLTIPGSSTSGRQIQMSYLIPLGVTPTTWYQGAAMYVGASDDGLGMFIGVGNTGVALMTVAMKPFGVVELWLGREGKTLGTKLASSPAGAYRADTWNYVEMSGFLVNSTAGHVQVRINTVPVISMVSTITQPTGLSLNSYMFGYNNDVGAGGGAINCFWDDVYLCDNQGADNNTYLGNVRVRSQVAASAGASTQYTPFPSAPNWQRASNLAVDDSAYVFDNTTGHFDLYNVTPIAASPQVFGVFILGAYRQNDATQRSASNTLKSGATTVDGAQYFTPGNYAFSIDCFERDPNTASPWVYTDVNLIQIGPKTRS